MVAKPMVGKPIELDVVLATQSVQFGPVGQWHSNFQCDWSLPRIYKDVNWDVYCCLPPAMKEYVSHYVGCHIAYDLAIDVTKKNMIEFSKLAKLDHYKKYMVHNVSSNIAGTN
jgi:hypothetical protein